MSQYETVKLTRACEAIEIPYGAPVMLPAGAEVRITQSLGGTHTVMTEDGYLVRIAEKDADALGKTPGAANPAATGQAGPVPTTPEEVERLAWRELETCFDPEIPVNVVDLGLVYGVRALTLESGGYRVEVKMTLTAPGCGMGDILKEDAALKIRALPGVQEADVEMVVEPPWDPSMMSDAARLQLNMM